MTDADLEERAVNVIRGLAMDAPQRAGNGHPGTAMALAPAAHTLFTRILRHDPSDPHWPDRDRFVLSCGHASILLYSMLYLTGYGLTLEDIRAFRQLESPTPGHPERRHTDGVEVTTGPLGQGFGNSVGMAIAEANLRARFGAEICDHHTFVFCSDGDLQEGVSHEAASLAGHLGLGRLVVVWDDNHITIDGPAELAWSDDTPARFRAYGWDVTEHDDDVANDLNALEKALRRGVDVEDRPSFIALRTHIGYGSSLQDNAKAHGSALGADVIREAKERLGLPPDVDFYVPDDVLEFYSRSTDTGRRAHADWDQRLQAYTGDRSAWAAAQAGTGIEGWHTKLPSWDAGESIETRKAGVAVLDSIKDVVPGLIAGGADLTDNTGVSMQAERLTRDDPAGRLIHFGIREHGMAAAMNGMAAHGGILPVGGTFFVFSDYARPSIRLAALSRLKVIYSFSHDSIGLGNDGPTHQPVEHLPSLRAMPGLRLIRPADANETAHAYRIAISDDVPTAILLTRQKVPVLEGTAGAFEGVRNGAYAVVEDQEADITLVASGSEVQLCLAAGKLLADRGIRTRTVSMPCWDLFEDASDEYQDRVLPVDVPVLAVEAASSFGWDRYADATVSQDTYGASGDGPDVFAHFGFTADHVADEAVALLEALAPGPEGVTT